jgi:hypothetical protein
LKADRPAYLSRNIYRFLRPLGFRYIHQSADNLLSSGFKLRAARLKTDALDLPFGITRRCSKSRLSAPSLARSIFRKNPIDGHFGQKRT